MRASRLAALALAVTTLWLSPPVAANPMLDRGIKLLADLENARAVTHLRRALRWKKNTSAELAKIHLYLGIAHFNLQQLRESAASFRRALELDPEIQLPRLTSPRIEELFNSLRPSAPEPPPAAPVGPTTEPAGEPPAPRPPPVAERPGPRPPRSRWPAWTAAGVGAAAGIVAVVLASLTVVENRRAEDLGLSSREAMEHHDAAAGRALGANVCFAIAGVAAVTSGVLFFLEWRRAKAARGEASVPRRTAAVELGVLRW